MQCMKAADRRLCNVAGAVGQVPPIGHVRQYEYSSCDTCVLMHFMNAADCRLGNVAGAIGQVPPIGHV